MFVCAFFFVFFFNATATTEIYTLSLHDALPISGPDDGGRRVIRIERRLTEARWLLVAVPVGSLRSEEHTSELQSLTNLVCRLLLEKKKKNKKNISSDSKDIYKHRNTVRRHRHKL